MARRPLRPDTRVAALFRRLVPRLLVGVALGALVLVVDRLLPGLPLAVPSTRTLFGAFVSGVVSAGVFSLWMRTVAVGLVSDQFSPRTLVVFLDDRFQIRLAGWMAAALACQIVLLAGVPEDEETVPAAALIVGSLVLLAAFSGVIYAVVHAVRSVDLTRLVHRLAEEVRRVIDAQPEHAVEENPPEVPEPDVEEHRLRAPHAGWVGDIDRPALLGLLPPGQRARLLVRVGSFVAKGQTLLEATGPVPSWDDVDGYVELRGDRRPQEDLAFALSQLIDVAEHALAQAGADTSTAHEALLQFSAVAQELLDQGLPPCHLHDEEDRWLVDEAAWAVHDHLRTAVERLRGPAARDPLGARQLSHVLAALRDKSIQVEDEHTEAEMERQLDTLLELTEREGGFSTDLRRLAPSTDGDTSGRGVRSGEVG